MIRLRDKLVSLLKDGPGELHPLAIASIALAFLWPPIGFFLGFIARTQIAFSNGKYSGDRLALIAIITAPVMQFQIFIIGALYLLFTVGLTL